MPELSESIAAIQEGAKADRFTYLSILQYHVTSPELLPTLNAVLEQDPRLAEEIGWDLVQMLLGIPGSAACLETVARLGNPREVIIKVMEALDGLADPDDGPDGDALPGKEEGPAATEAPPTTADTPAQFVILLGMLAILHRRIRTRYPSRFLGPTLVKVFEAYQPTPEMTAAVINLVRSLSGGKRPPLPSRKSSINVLNPDQDGDASKNAPDPEAENEDPTEAKMQERLLQAFVTCILQRYVNENNMQWAPRLLERYNPKRSVPGKKTITQTFTEDGELHQRDGVVGNLAALARDLGLNDCSEAFVKSIYENASADSLASFDDSTTPADIHLSPGGAVCLMAYWVFSAEVFDADSPRLRAHIFPDHITLLLKFLGNDAQKQICESPGVADALLVVGLGLYHKGLMSATEDINVLSYHHHLTLLAVFHPDIQVRNAATSFAGTILHSDPDDQNRLEILEDLFENCMFAALKACAVTWLKEELMAAKAKNSVFSTPDVIDKLRYVLFPDTSAVRELEGDGLVEYWAQNGPFLLQVANFAYFLFSPTSGFHELAPAGLGPAVEMRFVEPLLVGLENLLRLGGSSGGGASNDGSNNELGLGLSGEEKMDVRILEDRLRSLPLH